MITTISVQICRMQESILHVAYFASDVSTLNTGTEQPL